MRRLAHLTLWLLAFVALAYVVRTGIGWFAFPFAVLAGAALAIGRTRTQPSASTSSGSG